MIGDAGISYGAKVDGIEAAQLVQPIFGHHATGLQISLATPIEMLPGKTYVMAASGGPQNSKALGHFFMSDAVSFDHCNLVIFQNASQLPFRRHENSAR